MSSARDRYVAMELIEGTTLRPPPAKGIPLSRAVAIARQIAEALAVAHAAQIVHRDIKPENVMVRPDGYVKLLDFGLARLHQDAVTAHSTGPAATEAGLVLGTIGYMAPEQARGERSRPRRTSSRSACCSTSSSTGRHPFTAASQLGTLHALMWETPEPPSLLNPELPRALDQLILEMLQKDARLRPGASEVMFRLNVAHDSSVAAALSSVTVAAAARRDRPEPRRPRERDGRSARTSSSAPNAARARLIVDLRRSRRGQDDAGRRVPAPARGERRSRSASAAAGARSGSPEAKPTCRSSRCSTACSATNSSAACRG